MKNWSKILMGVLLIAIVVVQVDTWRIRHEIKSYDRAMDTVNIGTTPNDGTGDPLRTAFIKINNNFDELYSWGDHKRAGYATPQDISDTIATYLDNATLGVALADSNIYDGGYATRTFVESLIGSGVSLATELQSLGANVKAIPIFCDMDASSSKTLTDAELFVTAVYLPEDMTITGARFSLAIQGDYTADNNNRIGLYKVSGTTATLVASTVNNGDLWKGAQYAWTNHPFSSTYSAEKGAYYIAFLYNNSAEVTAPRIYCGEPITLAHQSSFMGNSVKVKGTLADQSDLPSSFNMTSASAKTESPMIILY